MHTDKRLVIRIEQRSFNRYAIDRVRSIEHNDCGAAFLTGAHAKIQRPNKSVVTRPDVLKVHKQDIEPFEHFRCRLAMFAVKAINRNVQDADARNFSIPPCCPGSGREIRAAGQRRQRDETNRRGVAPGSAMRVQGWTKPKPDEAARRCARREISSAKAQLNDQPAIERHKTFYYNTGIVATNSMALTQTPYNVRQRVMLTENDCDQSDCCADFANSSPWRT